jgi:hypothetical protein
VNVLEPTLPELQAGANKTGSDAQSNVALKEVTLPDNKDIRARWTRTNEDDESARTSGGGEVNMEGLMEWICRVDPNSSIDL